MRQVSNSESQNKSKPLRRPRSRTKRWLWRLLFFGLLCVVLGVVGIVGLFWYVGRDLPDLRHLKNYKPWRITRILDVDGDVMREVAHQYRTPILPKQMPEHLIHAVVAAEDGDFFRHKGLDYFGMMRAFWKNLWRSKGAPLQGGSTITQQVVKTFLLSPEQVYSRKIKEAILARRLEQNLKKKEILYLYLNQIDFGNGRYGVEEAARFYFRKPAHQLTLHECAILAGIPKHPPRYNPVYSPTLTQRRRNYVLRRMWQQGYITKAEYEKTLQIEVVRPKPWTPPPFQHDHYAEAVRQRALRILATHQTWKDLGARERTKRASLLLYRGGLTIETAMDPVLQQDAKRALRRRLRAVDQSRGYRGPLKRFASRKQGEAWLRKHRDRSQPHGPELRALAMVVRWSASTLWVKRGTEQIAIPRASMTWANYRPVTRQGKLARRKQSLPRVAPPGSVLWIRQVIPQERAAARKQAQMLGLSTSSKRFVPAPRLRPSKTRWVLDQIPLVEGAVVAIHPSTHRVRALVGGRYFRQSPFNRATQARRQPGSTFKPLLYAAALESRRYTAASLVNDTYLSILSNGKRWEPANSQQRFSNRPVSLRRALVSSLNTVAVRVLDRLGPPRLVKLAQRLGIESKLSPDLPLALGASAVKPLELTNAYATLAAHGVYDQPVLITRILDHEQKVLYERLPQPKRVLSAGVSFIVTHMMQDVVRVGSGRRAAVLRRPVAGKTGTTNDARNAWFVGYTPELCVGTWVGFDDRRTLGPKQSGARTALPIFVDVMKGYHTTQDGNPRQIRSFHVPAEVLFVKIDPRSGDLAPSGDSSFVFEAFLKGTQPTRYAARQQGDNFYHMNMPF